MILVLDSEAAWIGVAGALGGVIVGSVGQYFAARADFKRDRAWVRRQELKGHVEQLWEGLESVRLSYAEMYRNTIDMLDVMPANATPLPLSGEKLPWAHLQMIANLYLRTLRPQLAAVEKAGFALGSAVAPVIARVWIARVRDQGAPSVDEALAPYPRSVRDLILNAMQNPMTADAARAELENAKVTLDAAVEALKAGLLKESEALAEEDRKATS